MTTKPHFIRKTILINRSIQLRYFTIFALLGGGLSTVFGFVVLAVIHQSDVEQGFSAEGSSMVHTSQGLFWWFLLAMILVSTLLGVAGVLITHRIVGPVFVMGRAMDLLTTGKYPQLRPLRDSDDLNELYASFRALIDSLLKTDRDDLATLDKALALIALGDPSSSAAARGLLLELQQKKSQKMSQPPAST